MRCRHFGKHVLRKEQQQQVVLHESFAEPLTGKVSSTPTVGFVGQQFPNRSVDNLSTATSQGEGPEDSATIPESSELSVYLDTLLCMKSMGFDNFDQAAPGHVVRHIWRVTDTVANVDELDAIATRLKQMRLTVEKQRARSEPPPR